MPFLTSYDDQEMRRHSVWKSIGLAGLAGVAATGVVVVQSERRRRAYTPHEVRNRLHERVAELAGATPVTSLPTNPPEQFPARAIGSVALSRSYTVGEILSVADAVEMTRTGDLWLFRGPSAADRAIQVFTNSPINHVGIAVVLGDLPPLMWHAELGHSLLDVWSGSRHRGVQLHDLGSAVTTWTERYHQGAWLRQLHADVTQEMEDALLREIARKDGTSFPTTLALVGRWARGRIHRPADIEASYCAEVVASAYQVMGLLDRIRPANWYDPGRFWSGDHLELLRDARLGQEIAVSATETPPQA